MVLTTKEPSYIIVIGIVIFVLPFCSTHRNAANAATKHIRQDAHLKIVRTTGRGKNKKQHAVRCGYIHIEANSGQLTV
jgi:hypothetical protein